MQNLVNFLVAEHEFVANMHKNDFVYYVKQLAEHNYISKLRCKIICKHAQYVIDKINKCFADAAEYSAEFEIDRYILSTMR